MSGQLDSNCGCTCLQRFICRVRMTEAWVIPGGPYRASVVTQVKRVAFVIANRLVGVNGLWTHRSGMVCFRDSSKSRGQMIPLRMFRDTHRVGRILSIFSNRQNWNSPTRSPAGECVPPSLRFRGEGTLAGGRGVGEYQFRRGDIHCGTLCVYMYFVGRTFTGTIHHGILLD